MDNISTGYLYDVVSRSEDIDEYKKLLYGIADQKKEWIQIIDKIVKDNGYSATELGRLCGVGRQAAQKWIKGSLPKKRETFIKIGFAAHYNLEEMNFFLQRYGRCTKLYPRSLEDSVYIFVLNSDTIEHSYESCQSIIDLLNVELTTTQDDDKSDNYETMKVLESLTNLSTLAEMLTFVANNATIYRTQYGRLYEYIEDFIDKNLLSDGMEDDNVTNLACSQQWSASLRQCVSEISQKKWYPQRNKIISLGIHLNMNLEQINKMLDYAQMEAICAKNPFENAIIYALENAQLEDIIRTDGTDVLCRYVKKILESLDYSGVDFFLEELPKDYDEDEIF